MHWGDQKQCPIDRTYILCGPGYLGSKNIIIALSFHMTDNIGQIMQNSCCNIFKAGETIFGFL